MNQNDKNVSLGEEPPLDGTDDWFNELDEKTLEIINNNLIKEPDDVERMGGHKEPEDCTECIYVEDIIEKKNMEKMTSKEIIQYECSVAYFIQVLVEGTSSNRSKTFTPVNKEVDLNMDKIKDILQFMKWLSNACGILAKRINQELLVYKAEQVPTIVRSSYNFCAKYTQCKNFYSKHEIPNCKEHHYVHSILKYDIDSVIYFLTDLMENNRPISKDNWQNLYLSIKTVCFVTRHMEKEISYIDYVTKNNSEIFHRNNPIDLNRKRFSSKNPRFGRERERAEGFSRGTESFSRDPLKVFPRDQEIKRIIQPARNGGFKNINSININLQKKRVEENNRFSVLSQF